jgi:hypothetical protein
MAALRINARELFNKCYAPCVGDPFVWLCDVRGNKAFKRNHLSQAFNVKLSANGKALVDYSQSAYTHTWSPGCWCVRRSQGDRTTPETPYPFHCPIKKLKTLKTPREQEKCLLF